MSDIRQLGPADAGLMDALLSFFGEAFNDPASYTGKRPSAKYLRKLLGGDSFIALAAFGDDGKVTGAAARGAWVIFVQADTQPEDEPAIALYTTLGVREDVLHFDIPVTRTTT